MPGQRLGAGKDGTPAVMIHGPLLVSVKNCPPCGHKLEGYDIVESNASDTRSKKLVETVSEVSLTQLLSWDTAGGGKKVEADKKKFVHQVTRSTACPLGSRGRRAFCCCLQVRRPDDFDMQRSEIAQDERSHLIMSP